MVQDRKLSKQELKIIELWEAGYTGQQIGKELSITRNAVMGKIYRLRRMAKLGYGHVIKTHSSPAVAKPTPPQEAQPTPVPAPRAKSRQIAEVLVLPASMARGNAPAKPRNGIGFTLMELKSGMCRYSTSGESASEYLFCGATAEKGPYCEHHYSLCYIPPKGRERGNTIIKKFLIEGRKF